MVAFDKIVLNVFEKWSVNCNDKCGGLYVVQARIFLGFLIRVSIQINSIFDNSKFFLCTKSCVCWKYKSQRFHQYQRFYFYRYSGTREC